MRGIAAVVTLAAIGACGGDGRVLSEGETSVGGNAESSPSTTIATTASSASSPTDASDAVDSSEDDGGGCPAAFYGGCPPDGGGTERECDIWAQDCMHDEKCMPWANDGGVAWNALRCSPLDPNPAEVGDLCMVEGSGVSGVDNCTRGSMCWNVDPETLEGTCVDFCKGSQQSPTCTVPEDACAISNLGVLALCSHACDPIAQDCGEGEGCYLLGSEYVCARTIAPGGHGESCGVIGSCAPGLLCLDDAFLLACDGRCCAQLCDFDAPDPNAACTGAATGEVCSSILVSGAPANVGVCRP